MASSYKLFTLAIISLAVTTEARLGSTNQRELVSDHILTEFKPVQPKPDPPGGFGSPSSNSNSGNAGRYAGTTTPPPPPPAPPVESYTITSSELPEQASEGSSAPPDEDLEGVIISGAMEEPPMSVPDSADDEDEGKEEGVQVTGGGSKHDGSFFNGKYPDIAAAFTPINP